jgi:hypothetical protein
LALLILASTGWWLSVALMLLPSIGSTLSCGCFLLDKHLFDDFGFLADVFPASFLVFSHFKLEVF